MKTRVPLDPFYLTLKESKQDPYLVYSVTCFYDRVLTAVVLAFSFFYQ